MEPLRCLIERAHDDVGEAEASPDEVPECDCALRVVFGTAKDDRQTLVLPRKLQGQRSTDPTLCEARMCAHRWMFEDHPEFDEDHVAGPTFHVSRPGADQSCQECRAQHRLVGRKWVCDLHAWFVWAQQIKVGVTAERRRPRLQGAGVNYHLAQMA